MRLLRTTLAIVLILIFVPLFWLQIGLQIARDTVLQPEFSKQMLRRSHSSEHLRTFISANLAETPDDAWLSAEDMVEIYDRLLPPERFYVMADDLIDGVYAWVYSDQMYPELLLDLRAVKQDVPPLLTDITRQRVESLPPCTAEQAAEMVGDGFEGLPPCRPAEVNVGELFDQVSDQLPVARLTADLPDYIDLGAQMQADPDQDWQHLIPIRTVVQRVHHLTPWGWVALALLLLLIGLSSGGLLAGAMFRVAGALLAAGLPLTAAGIGAVVFSDLATTVIGSGPEALAAPLLSAVAQALAGRILHYGIVTTAIGALCLAGAYLWQGARKRRA